MPAFQYRALNAEGHVEKGVLEGDSARQVRGQLRADGLTPLDVARCANKHNQKHHGGLFRRKMSKDDLALMTRQLAALIQASLPIESALEAVSEQTEREAVRQIVVAVRSRVREGRSFASGLADFPHIFSDFYRATVDAGERSGQLALIMQRLADYVDSQQKIAQSISQALIYPIMMIFVSSTIVTFLLVEVVPQIVSVFQQNNQALPTLTVALIAVSAGLRAYGLYVLLSVLGVWLIWRRVRDEPVVRLRTEQIVFRLPLVGRLIIAVNTARYARTLSILSAAGVPIVEAMMYAKKVIGFLGMQRAVGKAQVAVQEGSSVQTALKQTGYFPAMVLHLVASGESSGQLAVMLERASDHQEREVVYWVNAVVRLFEPLMVLFMGGVILLIVLAVMLPIFDMNQLVK